MTKDSRLDSDSKSKTCEHLCRHVSADRPESRHVSADHPESPHVLAEIPEPRPIMAAKQVSP